MLFMLSTCASCVVVASGRAASSPQSARSYGKASLVISIIGMVIAVVVVIISVVFAVVVGAKTVDKSMVSVSFHCLQL